jgi:hypothetical protein
MPSLFRRFLPVGLLALLGVSLTLLSASSGCREGSRKSGLSGRRGGITPTTTPEARFWSWFAARHARYRGSSKSGIKKRLLDRLIKALHRYHPKLWAMVGGDPKGTRELIITAEGDPKQFPAVRRLIRAAPKINGWRFIAFKPASGFDFKTTYEGVPLDPAKMWFLSLRSNTGSLGLRIGVPGYDEAKKQVYMAGCLFVLDTALGELRAAEEIQRVEVVTLPPDPKSKGYLPLVQLARYLDRHKPRIAPRRAVPRPVQ